LIICIIVLVSVIFLVVHLHHDYLVTILELSHILTNTLNNVFYLLSEINIFNKLLLFAWHDIAFLCSAESAVKHQPTLMLRMSCKYPTMEVNSEALVEWKTILKFLPLYCFSIGCVSSYCIPF